MQIVIAFFGIDVSVTCKRSWRKMETSHTSHKQLKQSIDEDKIDDMKINVNKGNNVIIHIIILIRPQWQFCFTSKLGKQVGLL